MDEYFSGEPLQDIAQFYSSFDSLPHPIIAQNDIVPLSPPESIPSPGAVNGQSDDTVQGNSTISKSFIKGYFQKVILKLSNLIETILMFAENL